MALTREQELEVDKAISNLKEARKHLDNAMYCCGDISDEDYNRVRSIYKGICDIQDKL